MVSITLNRREHGLYFTAKNVITANRRLRALGRLQTGEDTKQAAVMLGTGDIEVLAIYIEAGIDHEKIPGLTADKIVGWLDTVMRKRREDFFQEIQRPVLDALKEAGQIEWSIEPAKPGDEAGEDDDEKSGEEGARPTLVSRT